MVEDGGQESRSGEGPGEAGTRQMRSPELFMRGCARVT